MCSTRDVIVFAPHPDDEVIACGGSILKRVAAGARVHIVFATDGSQSHNAVLGIASEPSPDELRTIRRGEAIAAAASLGVPAERLLFVGAEDTRLIDALDLLRGAVDGVLAQTADLAEVFIPHERRELNADHSLTGRIVLERLAVGGWSPRVLKYVVWDAEVEAEFGFVNRAAETDDRIEPETLHEEDVTEHLEARYAALLQHRTQTSLFSPLQRRAVVPPGLLAKVRTDPIERFWVAV